MILHIGVSMLVGPQGSAKSLSGIAGIHYCCEQLTDAGVKRAGRRLLPVIHGLLNDRGSLMFCMSFNDSVEAMCLELLFIAENYKKAIKFIKGSSESKLDLPGTQEESDKKSILPVTSLDDLPSNGLDTLIEAAVGLFDNEQRSNEVNYINNVIAGFGDEVASLDTDDQRRKALEFWSFWANFIEDTNSDWGRAFDYISTHPMLAATQKYVFSRPSAENQTRVVVMTEQDEYGDTDDMPDFEISFMPDSESFQPIGNTKKGSYVLDNFWLPIIIMGRHTPVVMCSWDSSIMMGKDVKDRSAKGGFSLGTGSVLQNMNKLVTDTGGCVLIEERIDSTDDSGSTFADHVMETRYGGFVRVFYYLERVEPTGQTGSTGWASSSEDETTGVGFSPNVGAARYRTCPHVQLKTNLSEEYKEGDFYYGNSTRNKDVLEKNVHFGFAGRITG